MKTKLENWNEFWRNLEDEFCTLAYNIILENNTAPIIYDSLSKWEILLMSNLQNKFLLIVVIIIIIIIIIFYKNIVPGKTNIFLALLWHTGLLPES